MALYAFDGTWNTEKDREDDTNHNTNVVKFHAAYQSASNRPQYYVEGVGTRFELLGQILGGAFGCGELPRLEEAYDRLCSNWANAKDDEDRTIDIIGFSRGAATTLDFVNVLRKRGIRRPNSDQVIEPNPRIRFLGLWDVVGSFGFACLGNQGLNFFHHLELPSANLDYCFHAMALDERRPSFQQIRLRGAREVWFRGVHSDIGGGNGNIGLSDITLKWMLLKAQAAGLPIRDADVNALAPDPTRPPQPVTKHLLECRLVAPVDRRHYSVADLPDWTNPPASCPTETAADERAAMKAGDVSVDTLPPDQRLMIVALAETAQATARAAEKTVEPATYDALIYLFQSRLPLITADTLKQAEAAASQLVARAIDNAHHAQFPTVEPVFLTQAIWQRPALFPLTD